MINETENQIRLRRAKESLATCQVAETEARKALARAIEGTKRARERYDELFIAEENQERARRIITYNHPTK
jgi:hypothetical protein